jgi:hypothetical protein
VLLAAAPLLEVSELVPPAAEPLVLPELLGPAAALPEGPGLPAVLPLVLGLAPAVLPLVLGAPELVLGLGLAPMVVELLLAPAADEPVSELGVELELGVEPELGVELVLGVALDEPEGVLEPEV